MNNQEKLTFFKKKQSKVVFTLSSVNRLFKLTSVEDRERDRDNNFFDHRNNNTFFFRFLEFGNIVRES